MHTLVLADGDRPRRPVLDATWPGWDEALAFVVAADGGAVLADELRVGIDAWVGDGDSVPPAALRDLEQRGVPIHRAPVDKDESDAELAITLAASRGATRLTILGALGGRRFDHALANVLLLAHPALREGSVRPALLDETTRVSLLASSGDRVASHSLVGRPGDVVTLLPLGAPVAEVTTGGLRYALAGEPLELGRTRGLSNVRQTEVATIAIRGGRLLIVETAATLGP